MKKPLLICLVALSTACQTKERIVYIEKQSPAATEEADVIYTPAPTPREPDPAAPAQVDYGRRGDDTTTTAFDRVMAARAARERNAYPQDTTAAADYVNEDDYRLAPGTQTMLGDDGQYHGRVTE